MGYKFNPFTGNFDTTDSPNGVFDSVEVDGDITLDDGGTYATTLQLITPTANRTISFPDATGTVALVGGSSGQLVYNNAGAYAGAPSTSVGATGNITLSLAGAASTPPVSLTGTWFSGGTSTTTKPQLLIEPNGTTSTAWSTGGTGLGVNAASGFGGRLFDFQINGSSKAVLDSFGRLLVGTSSARSNFAGNTATPLVQIEGVTAATASSSVVRGAADTTGPTFNLGKTRGASVGQHTVVASGDQCGVITFQGADGTNLIRAAQIAAEVDGTPGANDMPGRLVFSTTADGSASPTERLRITSAGVLQVADAGNIAVGTTTGTKIGTATTQKLGFYNATPVMQPAAVADATDAATVITQLNDLLAKLRTLGIIAT